MRSVRGVERRVAEAKRMGFSRVVVPSKFANTKKGGYVDNKYTGIQVLGCGNLLDAVNCGLVEDVSQAMRYKNKGKAPGGGGARAAGRGTRFGGKGTKFPTSMKDLAFDEDEVYEDEGDEDEDEDDDEYGYF